MAIFYFRAFLTKVNYYTIRSLFLTNCVLSGSIVSGQLLTRERLQILQGVRPAPRHLCHPCGVQSAGRPTALPRPPVPALTLLLPRPPPAGQRACQKRDWA
jgi:hypothetical protein